MSLTPARRNPTRSFNRGDSHFNVGAAGAFDPAVKENVKFDDEAPKGMHQSHHTALTKHGYEYTGRNGSGAHTYRHQRTGSTAEHKGGTTSLLPHGRPQLQIRTSSASELHSHLQKYHGELSHPLNRDAGGRMSDGQPEATFAVTKPDDVHPEHHKALTDHGYRYSHKSAAGNHTYKKSTATAVHMAYHSPESGMTSLGVGGGAHKDASSLRQALEKAHGPAKKY